MLSMYFPSRWRNLKNGREWRLTFSHALGGRGRPGVEAACLNGAGKGEIWWKEAGTTLDLLHVMAQPRRTGLGTLLTFAFAGTAVDIGLPDVTIASANPEEHGFYRAMGFDYDRAVMINFVTHMPELFMPTNVKDESGKPLDLTQAQLSCPLVGGSGFVKTRSEAAAERTWQPVL